MDKSKIMAVNDEVVINKIYLLRDNKVMIDRDLAEMYGVETKVLNQAVKRNMKRFPPDFMFQMTIEELANWKSQIVTSNFNQINMGMRKLPNVFTEQGIAMLSSVLKSEIAKKVMDNSRWSMVNGLSSIDYFISKMLICYIKLGKCYKKSNAAFGKFEILLLTKYCLN